jgi:beta-1,4-mannosyl-glycoprotein beta-1,4-N-acetylglucosaminyltransferase
MKIYDCFIFNNELDLLELRLNILDDVVDKFVIIEGKKTFAGNDKESIFLKNKEKFSRLEDKIIYRYIDIPDFSTTWDREIYSRNYALTLSIYEDDDVIISSDIDEIPNPEAIRNINQWINDSEHFTFQMNFYMYYINNFVTNKWFGSRVAKYNYLKNTTLDNIRETTEDRNKITGSIIDGGGWHFSYLGGKEMIKNKIQSFSHIEYNTQNIISNISENLENNRDLFDRPTNFNTVDITEEEYPTYIVENKENYFYLIK